MQKIQRVSKGMVFILTLALIATVCVALALVVFPDLSIEPIYGAYNLSPDIPPLSAWQYGAIATLAALNFVPTLYVIWQLRKMFRLFARGEVFTATTTRHLFNAAKGMVAWGLIAIASTTIAVLVLTANAAKGGHVLVLDISSGDLAGIFTGVVFVVMSWVMQEAARLSEENAGFI